MCGAHKNRAKIEDFWSCGVKELGSWGVKGVRTSTYWRRPIWSQCFLATTHHQQNHDKGSQDSSRQKKKVGWLLAWFMAEIRGLPCGHEQCYCSNVLLWKDIRFLCKICTKCFLTFMEKTTSPDFITTKKLALNLINKRLQSLLRRYCHSAKSD